MFRAIRVDENTDKHVLADYFESFAKALRNGCATPAIGNSLGELTRFGRVWSVSINAEFWTPHRMSRRKSARFKMR
jgi:hypothetical protein